MQLNTNTEFGSHYTGDGSEANPDKAAWTLRQLERLFSENAISERAREAHIRRRDLRRRQYRATRQVWPYLKEEIANVTSRYGESLGQVINISLLIIVLFALLYPFLGGIEAPKIADRVTYTAGAQTIQITLPGQARLFLVSFYFSVTNFIASGGGGWQAATTIGKILATIESFTGAGLLALFAYTLRERIT